MWKYPLVFLAFAFQIHATFEYWIGTGSYDVTGPAADVTMMGYAKLEQKAAGIHLRLRARSFIIGDDTRRLVYVSIDACMASQAVTTKVISELKSRYGSLYDERNVAISGIHTHSGPGGYLQYVLYSIASMGFVRQSYDAIVHGIVQSIVQAHNSLKPGTIFVNQGRLLGANINRSPSAYLENPEAERKRYENNTDTDMLLLKFVDDESQRPVGALNWFPVHCTSMSNNNSLISGDNKGAASRFMEDWFTKPITGHEDNRNRSSNIRLRNRGIPFVAAFAQSNEGDVSPNTLGAFCGDSNLRCDFNHSTCNGRSQACIARGPGYPDEFASTKIIAERQASKAIELFSNAKEKLSGLVKYKHKYVDFTNITVQLNSSLMVKTCPAAMGFSFAAGTTDGPGAFGFTQGDTEGNPFWKMVGSMLKKPSEEQTACQAPKPILLDTGEMNSPYAWAPAILPIQILQIGQLFILSVPAEFSTMAGRRLKESVKKTLLEHSGGVYEQDKIRVLISGLTNTYSSYVTTFEEYQAQRYEGASTLYGPHTLSAYIQEFNNLAVSLVENLRDESSLVPPDFIDKQISFLFPVLFDSTPAGVKFGDVKRDVESNATFKQNDKVVVEFWSGSPRNDLMTERTFGLVEFLEIQSREWIAAYDDDDWSLKFIYSAPAPHQSVATIEWEIPSNAAQGKYRIRHFGSYKSLFQPVQHFTATSSIFLVN